MCDWEGGGMCGLMSWKGLEGGMAAGGRRRCSARVNKWGGGASMKGAACGQQLLTALTTSRPNELAWEGSYRHNELRGVGGGGVHRE